MSGSKRGLQLYKCMEIGELVPAEIVLDILAEVMLPSVQEVVTHLYSKLLYKVGHYLLDTQ